MKLMEPIYYFIHLAKTGGTTFVGNLYKNMDFDVDFIDLGPHGNNYRKEHSRLPLEKRTQEELEKIKIIAGHLVYWNVSALFPNRESRFITFLREPISRVISHYTFDSSKENISFSDWYKNWIHNQTYYFLCDHLQEQTLQGVLEKLKQFWHIGVQANLNASLNHIYTTLGLPLDYENRRVAGEPENTTKDLGYDVERKIKNTYVPTAEEKEMIESDHKLDSWLYQHILTSLIDFRYKPKEVTIPEEFLMYN
jgi:hypothetical protein